MKKNGLTIAVLTAATMVAAASPAQARVNVDLHIGAPPPVIVAPPPPPLPPPGPGYRHRPHYDRRPDFIYTPRLGFSVSVGGPYDMIWYGDRYYIYDNDGWYWSSAYNGPWMFIEYNRLPRGIRRFHYDDIRRYRDDEYRRRYHDDRRDWRDRRDWDDRRGPDRGPYREPGPDRWR